MFRQDSLDNPDIYIFAFFPLCGTVSRKAKSIIPRIELLINFKYPKAEIKRFIV